MKNLYRIKRTITNALQEPIVIIDSKILVTEELDGLVHPTKIQFGKKDAQAVARYIVKKLERL